MTAGTAAAHPATRWSDQQRAIFEWFRAGEGNMVVRARAGTGKTTTIVEGITHAPERSILLCAFNKRIATELEEKLRNPHASAKTLHGLGFAAVRRYWSDVRVNARDRAETLSRAIAGDQAPDPIVRLLSKLHTKAREMCPLATAEDLEDLAVEFECEPDASWEHEGYDLAWMVTRAAQVMELAATTKPATGIDFADMLFLPVRNGWLRPQYDLVVVDECLPYWTPVLLADGSSRPIGELVESRAEVEVMSYDTSTGEQVPRRVTAWQKIPNRKPLVKIAARRPAPGNAGRHFVVCTVDHPIWTENRGWVKAAEVCVGDTVQVETAAEKSQRYKTTSAGRRSLGDLRAQGDRPAGRQGRVVERGGNGRGPTRPELALHEALGTGWDLHFVVPTGSRVRGGAPSHYKIDIANPRCKVAIEVDGRSHGTTRRREQDLRKERWLTARGWRVFRFSNREAWQRPQACAAEVLEGGACPKAATVVSVDPVDIRDDYVYDLTVEGTHCFYANSMLVHNCQDMNATQLTIAQGVARGRIAVVGDDRQAIYAFRGADSSSLDRLKTELKASEFGLQVTYRCGTQIVAEAQRIVPDYRAAEGAHAGEIRTIPLGALPAQVELGDFVLSRKNAPLVSCALKILAEGKRAKIEGRDIGKGLVALVRRTAAGRARNSMPEFLGKLERWQDREVARATAQGKRGTARIEQVLDQADTIRALAQGLSGVGELIARIENLFADREHDSVSHRVTCSSVHRAKGLEADRVFVLRDTLNPAVPCTCGHWPGAHRGGNCSECDCDGHIEDRGRRREEENISYVAVTRARNELVWVRK